MDKMIKFSDYLNAKTEVKKVNESHIDDDAYAAITNTPEYKELRSKVQVMVDEFRQFLIDNGEEIGFDEGSNDHDMALSMALSELTSDDMGY